MAGDFLSSGDLSEIINVEAGGANSPLASKYDGVLRTCSRNSAGSTLGFSDFSCVSRTLGFDAVDAGDICDA
jgi:hypothetical protein